MFRTSLNYGSVDRSLDEHLLSVVTCREQATAPGRDIYYGAGADKRTGTLNRGRLYARHLLSPGIGPGAAIRVKSVRRGGQEIHLPDGARRGQHGASFKWFGGES